MAREDGKTLHRTGKGLVARARGAARGSKVTFGSVTVTGAKPTAAAVKSNVERSTLALARVTSKLVKPGIILRAKAGVPQFSVDEREPGVFVRRLNGRTERGRLVDGAFQTID